MIDDLDEDLPPIIKLRLLAVDGMLDNQLLDQKATRKTFVLDVVQYFTAEIDGLALAQEKFNYDLFMDLFRVMSELDETELGEPDFWSVILSIIQEKANKKAFFYGSRAGPSLDDVEMMLA